MKKEINDNSIWKEPEPKRITSTSTLLESNLRQALENDFKEHLKKSMREFKEKTQITNRFEILDL